MMGRAEELDKFGGPRVREAFGDDVGRSDAVEPFAAGRNYIDRHDPFERFTAPQASNLRAQGYLRA
ncbi:MAG TPA: hypothetical protein VE197_21090, partial [Mycobacterium sp.]|nr:hypothetical protein [Mycobacterium sp.]